MGSKRRFYMLILGGACAALCAPLNARGETGWSMDAVGIRVGAYDEWTYSQTELFASCNVPWRYYWNSGFWFQTRLDGAMGAVGGQHQYGFIASAGPNFVFGLRSIPLSLDLGSSPTVITRDEFGSKDIGSRFQMTSHFGLNWEVTSHFRFGYRYQHMSNAGINSDHNPGFNLHVIALSYVF